MVRVARELGEVDLLGNTAGDVYQHVEWGGLVEGLVVAQVLCVGFLEERLPKACFAGAVDVDWFLIGDWNSVVYADFHPVAHAVEYAAYYAVVCTAFLAVLLRADGWK